MSANLVPFSSAGGFVTAGNITTTGSGGDITMSGGNITGAGNISLDGGYINGGTATVVTDGINSIALSAGAQMDLFGFPFSAGTARGQLTITGNISTTQALGTWYYQSVNSYTYQLYTDSTYSTLANASGWTAYTGGGEVAITLQDPPANIVVNSNGYLSTFTNAGQLNLPGALTAVGDIGTDGNLYVTDATFSGSILGANTITAANLIITNNANIANLTYNNITNLTTANLVLGLGNTQTGTNVNGGGMVVGNTAEASFVYNYSSSSWVSNINLSAAGNVLAGGFVSSTGNVSGGNIRTVGQVSATGNITGAYIFGNGSQLTGLAASYGNANVATFLAAYGSNTISTTGNVTANFFIGNGSQLTGIVSSYGNANVVANLAALGSNPVSSTGNVSGGNIRTVGQVSATGNITGAYIFGNGSQLTGISGVSTYGNSNVITLLAAYGSNTISTTGDVTAGNLSTSGSLSADGATIAGALAVTGGAGVQIYDSTLTANTFSASATLGPGFITSSGTISAGGNVTGGNVLTGGVVSSTGNITGNYFIGNVSATTISASGNITAGNVSVTGNVYNSGGQIFGVPASYLKYTRSTAQTSGSFPANSVVICNVLESSFGSDISANTTTGQVTLVAGKTYRLRGMMPSYNGSPTARPSFGWYNETTSAYVGEAAMAYSPADAANNGAFGGTAEAVITPGVTTVVSFRMISSGSTVTQFGQNGDFSLTGNYPWIDVQVIGGQAPITGFSTTGTVTGTTVITTPVALASLTAVAGGRAFVNNANLVAAGNFGAQVGSGGSNVVPVWSNGTNWYIG